MSDKIVKQRKEHIRNMRICRLCLCRDKPLINVHERSTLSVPLAVQIMACLPIEVYPTDGLPPSICPVCSFFVQQSYAFRHVTLRGERALNDVLQTGVYSGAIPYPDDLIENMKLATANTKHKHEKEYEEESQVLDIEIENESNVTLKTKDVNSKKETSTINVTCEGGELHISAEPPEGSGDEQEEEEEEDLEDEEEEELENEEEEEEMDSEELDLDTSYEGEGFACNQCDRAFPLSQLLKLHVKQHHRHRNAACEVCDQRFFTKYDLMTHMLVHTGVKPFRCVVCRAAFSRLTLLKRHEKEVHPDVPKLHCSECTLTFLSEEELEAHSSKHRLYQTRAFQCTECPKKFHSKQGLTRHVAAMHKDLERTFKCDYCPEGFLSMTKLMRHVQGHASRPYPCKYCDKTFIKSHHYTRHLRMKHDQATTELRRGQNTTTTATTTTHIYKCEQCDETFHKKDDLIYHSAIHATQDLTCPLCKEQFPDIDAVTHHVKSHMTGQQYMCELCQLVFTSDSRLEQHLQQEHEEDMGEHDDEEEMEEDEQIKMEEAESYSMEVSNDFVEDKSISKSQVEQQTRAIDYTLELQGPDAAAGVQPAQDSNELKENGSEVVYTELKTVDTIKIAQDQLPSNDVSPAKKKEQTLQKTPEVSPQKIKSPPSTSAQKLDKAKLLLGNMKGVSIQLQRVIKKPSPSASQVSVHRPALTRAESERLGERRARHERGKEKVAQKRMSSSMDEGTEAKRAALAKLDDKKQSNVQRKSSEVINKTEILNKQGESSKKATETIKKEIETTTLEESQKLTKTVEQLKRTAETAKKVVELKKPIESPKKLVETNKKSGESMRKPTEPVRKVDASKMEGKLQPAPKSNDKSLKMLEKDLLELKMGARASLNTSGRSSARSADKQTDSRKVRASSLVPQASSTPIRKQTKHVRETVHSTPASPRSSSPMFSPPQAKSQNTKSTKKESVAKNCKSPAPKRDSTPTGSGKPALARRESIATTGARGGTPAAVQVARAGLARRESIATSTPVSRDGVTPNNIGKEDKDKIKVTATVIKKALGIAARGSNNSNISEASPRRSSRPCKVKDYAKMIKNNASTDEDEDADSMQAEQQEQEEESERKDTASMTAVKQEEDSTIGGETEVKQESISMDSKATTSESKRSSRGRPRKAPQPNRGRPGARGRGRGATRGRARAETFERSLSDEDTDFSDDGDDEYELPKEKKTRKVYSQQNRSSVVGTKVQPSISTPGAPHTGVPASGAPAIVSVAPASSQAPATVSLATPLATITRKLTPVTPPATIAQQAAAMRLQQGSPAKQGTPDTQGVCASPATPKLLVTPSGQTLTPVGTPTLLKNLPPGAKPTTLPPGKSILQGVGAGQLVDMRLGQRKVKVQKIVMSKQEVERMAKSGMLEMKDGAMVLKTGYKLPASYKSQVSLKPQTQVKQEGVTPTPTPTPTTTPATAITPDTTTTTTQAETTLLVANFK